MCALQSPIPWYPGRLAWRLGLSRRDLRRNRELSRFFEWVKLHERLGHITRQEEVSMLPALLLDPEPHHLVCGFLN